MRTAGLSALQSDSDAVHQHLEEISKMPRDVAQEANRIMTGTKAMQIREVMERIEQLRCACGRGLQGMDLAALHTALQSLDRIRAQYRALLSLTFRINQLPPELLMRIFRFSIWPLSATYADMAGAVRLTHVCHLWRSIAHKDQRLWNPVCFLEPTKYELGFAIMECAGSTGWDVRIRDKQSRPMTREEMALLMNRISRWISGIRRLDVFTFNKDALVPVLETLGRISQHGTPVTMEFLELHTFLASSLPNPDRFGQPLFGGLIPPFFKHLVLDGVNVDWGVRLLSRLTTLDLRRMSMETLPPSTTFRAILQHASSLEKLVFDAAGPMHPPNVPPGLPPIVLSTLKILVIGGCTDAYFEYMLSYFTSPNVLDLTITHPMSSTFDKLVASLTTHNRMPLVRTLTLAKLPHRDRPFPTDQAVLMAKWLVTMPNLNFLRIIAATPDLFDVLLLDQTTMTFAGAENWPADRPRALVSGQLKYMDWQTDVADAQQIQHCLATRKALGFPLKRLWIAPRVATYLSWDATTKLFECLADDGVVALSDIRTDEEDISCPLVYPMA